MYCTKLHAMKLRQGSLSAVSLDLDYPAQQVHRTSGCFVPLVFDAAVRNEVYRVRFISRESLPRTHLQYGIRPLCLQRPRVWFLDTHPHLLGVVRGREGTPSSASFVWFGSVVSCGRW